MVLFEAGEGRSNVVIGGLGQCGLGHYGRNGEQTRYQKSAA